MRSKRLGRRAFGQGLSLLVIGAGCSSTGDDNTTSLGGEAGIAAGGDGGTSSGSRGGYADGSMEGGPVVGSGDSAAPPDTGSAGDDASSGAGEGGADGGGYYHGAITVACNAYCFNDELTAYLKSGSYNWYGTGGPGSGGLSLMTLLDWCADAAHKFDAVDLTGYYFDPANVASSDPSVMWSSPPAQQLADLKSKAANLGLAISGTGIQNDFGNPAYRQYGIDRFKMWCGVANAIGAPKIRIFAGNLPLPTDLNDAGAPATRDDWLQGMIDALGQVAMIAKANGLIACVQNHGDMIATADQFIQVLQAVNMPDSLRADDDTGYFLEGGDICAGLTKTCGGNCVDPSTIDVNAKYAAIGRMLPYAGNMQVKSSITPVKHCPPIPMDLNRLFTIIRNGPYRGHVPLESLKPGYQGAPTYDGASWTAMFLQQVRGAIAATA